MGTDVSFKRIVLRTSVGLSGTMHARDGTTFRRYCLAGADVRRGRELSRSDPHVIANGGAGTTVPWRMPQGGMYSSGRAAGVTFEGGGGT